MLLTRTLECRVVLSRSTSMPIGWQNISLSRPRARMRPLSWIQAGRAMLTHITIALPVWVLRFEYGWPLWLTVMAASACVSALPKNDFPGKAETQYRSQGFFLFKIVFFFSFIALAYIPQPALSNLGFCKHMVSFYWKWKHGKAKHRQSAFAIWFTRHIVATSHALRKSKFFCVPRQYPASHFLRKTSQAKRNRV